MSKDLEEFIKKQGYNEGFRVGFAEGVDYGMNSQRRALREILDRYLCGEENALEELKRRLEIEK